MFNDFFTDKSTSTPATFSPPHKKFRLSVLQAEKDEGKEEEVVSEVEHEEEVETLDVDEEVVTEVEHEQEVEMLDVDEEDQKMEESEEEDAVDNMDDSDVINNDNMYDLDGDDGESDKDDEEKDDEKKDPNFSPFKTRSSSRTVRKRPDFYQAG